MAHRTLDAMGLRGPQPVLKVTAMMAELKPGDTLEVLGTCPNFEKDIRAWCDRLKKPLLWLRREEKNVIRCQIQF